MAELINSGAQADVVCRLAFTYMEMCKVDSSSDSESENRRWSDVSSSKGCESSTPENRGARRRLQRISGPNYQQTLDPYDGSSEDSASSSEASVPQGPGSAGLRSAVQQGAGGAVGRAAGLRSADVQMPSSGSELDLSDSGFTSRSWISSPGAHTPLPAAHTHTPLPAAHTHTPLPAAHTHTPLPAAHTHTPLPKRKFFIPAGEPEDGMRRKRKCVSDMELETAAL
ncbi:uncharacterized protein [Danio rerio]|uniref:Uncharacterized protein n=1 Tax=Danio rerio TaxID=7955 RepID=A0AC58HPZ9_DANRE